MILRYHNPWLRRLHFPEAWVRQVWLRFRCGCGRRTFSFESLAIEWLSIEFASSVSTIDEEYVGKAPGRLPGLEFIYGGRPSRSPVLPQTLAVNERPFKLRSFNFEVAEERLPNKDTSRFAIRRELVPFLSRCSGLRNARSRFVLCDRKTLIFSTIQ